jgi:hypothetical protein
VALRGQDAGVARNVLNSKRIRARFAEPRQHCVAKRVEDERTDARILERPFVLALDTLDAAAPHFGQITSTGSGFGSLADPQPRIIQLVLGLSS